MISVVMFQMCNKRVDSSILCERESEIYCKSCYGRNFGPKAGRHSGLIFNPQSALTCEKPRPKFSKI
jgi:hypothetical protein